MTAEERYRRFQIHNTSATKPWSALYNEDREAWESFNEEIDSEKSAAVRFAMNQALPDRR
jgi:lipopolysaccharide biosynthesis glycosyltransferase